MDIIKRVIDDIKARKKRLEDGKLNCIPFRSFPRLCKYIPGIEKGKNWIVTANPGGGKTQFTKFTFVFDPFLWVQENPQHGMSIEVLYFALEESAEEFVLSMLNFLLSEKYKINKSMKEMKSPFTYSTVSDSDVKIIESCEQDAREFMENIKIFDNVSNPYGIYKEVRKHAIANGTLYYEDSRGKGKTITYNEYVDLGDEEKASFHFSHYESNDPERTTVVIVDHFSLLTPEKEAPTMWEAMSKMSAEYGRKQISKNFKYVFVNVQQQNADSESVIFNNMGKKVIEKFRPSTNYLANNKETNRDAFVTIGLFHPHKHAIPEYQIGDISYDISMLKNNFRSALILKNREGEADLELPMFFNGKTHKFRELPIDREGMENVYKQLRQIRQKEEE